MSDEFADLLVANLEHAATFGDRFDDVQEGQAPDAVTVCCSDSRVLQDEMWGNAEPGHVFTVGNIGNRVTQRPNDAEPVVSGDVVYPIAYAGTDVAVVVGHTGCGAVTATYEAIRHDRAGEDGAVHPAGVERCLELLRPGLEPGVDELPEGLDDAAAVNRLVEYNVDRQVAALRNSEDVPDDVAVYGVVYDFQDVYEGSRGEVHVVNVDGERDPDALRARHPELADRVDRLLEY